MFFTSCYSKIIAERHNIFIKSSEEITSHFRYENANYVITNKIDLQGKILTIPVNCEISFNGGFITNGTVKGNNTIIDEYDCKIFDKDVRFEGTFRIVQSNPRMFGAFCDGYHDDVVALNNMHKVSRKIVYKKGIYLIDGTYCPYWEHQFQNYGGIWVQSNQNVNFEKDAKIKVKEIDTKTYSAFLLKGKSNVTITNANIEGFYFRNDISWDYQHGHGIYITSSSDNFASVEGAPSKNIKVINLFAKKFKGDAINLSKGDDVELINITGVDVFRNVITLGCCRNVNIKNIISQKKCFPDVGGPVIDIETDFENCYYENIHIDGVKADGVLYGINVVPYRKCSFRNVVIENVSFSNIRYRKSKESRGFCYFLNHPENYRGKCLKDRCLTLRNWTFNGYHIDDQLVNNIGLSYSHYLMYFSGWCFYGMGHCIVENVRFDNIEAPMINNDALIWIDTHGLNYSEQVIWLRNITNNTSLYLLNNQGNRVNTNNSLISTNKIRLAESPFSTNTVRDILRVMKYK